MEDFEIDAHDLRVSLAVSVYVVSPEADDNVEQWRAELFWRPSELKPEQQLATADFLVVPAGFVDPAEALDALSADAAVFVDLFDGDELDESVDAEGFAGVVIVDRVEVIDAMRRRGLGPLLVSKALQRIGRGCALAACSDSPLGDGAAVSADVESIRRMVRDFGFTEWREGIWTFDLTTTVLSTTRLAIRKARLGVVD
ncbi:MAG: hypothetical protein O3C27_17740 [Actinomycetota bacterium]|nr:hypothetical protein [Actinomycetota bacterium]